MKSIILFMLFVISVLFPAVLFGNELNESEQDVEAVESITRDFCHVNNLCDGKQHGEFVITKFNKKETLKLLTELEKKTIVGCAEIYEIRLKFKMQNLFIYTVMMISAQNT